MRNKKLSIIIPAYNAETYIEECLSSMTDFMADNLEILVVNDGSTDKTEEIAERCRQRDSRIVLITIDNGGVSRARNTGLEKASGEFILFLDADDYLLKPAFEKLTTIIEGGNYDFAAFSRMILEADGRTWLNAFPQIQEQSEDKAVIDSIMYTDSLFNECWGKLYRKTIIDEHSLRFPVGVPIGEDLMFVMQYYSHCQKVYGDNTALVAYRQHGGSAMRKYSIEDRMRLTEDIYSFSKAFIPEELKSQNIFYNFKILTNLCREYSKDCADYSVIAKIYSSKMKEEVIGNLNGSLVPLYRKHEYFFMKRNMKKISALYYHLKARA
jgi:glycosyltransferase involved in cell wall biosynthesis